MWARRPGCTVFPRALSLSQHHGQLPHPFPGSLEVTGKPHPSLSPHPLVGQCPCLPRHHAQSLTAETQDPIDSLSAFYITWRRGGEKGRLSGQPQGSEQALGVLGGARCQAEGVPGMHVLCLDSPFHHGPQNCPSVCPGGCTADGKKQPEGRKGDKGRDGGWREELTVPSVCPACPL